MEDAVIAGAGPIGLACAVSAKRRGLDPLLLDAGVLVHSITRYPIGMTFFTTPERMEIGGHPLVCADRKSTRLNSSHGYISYAVFCLKKKTAPQNRCRSTNTI